MAVAHHGGHARVADAGRLAFFREFLKSPVQLGTCFTSSRPLARGIVRGMGLENARAVIEFGPGPGPVTREILRRVPKDCKFFAIERNEGLAQEFSQRFPSVPCYNDDAANVRALCEKSGIEPGTVDCIVSTLPFLLFPPDVQRRILHEAAGVLRPGGKFHTITYRMAKVMPSVQRFKSIIREEFGNVSLARIVLANIPPTYIYRAVKSPVTR